MLMLLQFITNALIFIWSRMRNTPCVMILKISASLNVLQKWHSYCELLRVWNLWDEVKERLNDIWHDISKAGMSQHGCHEPKSTCKGPWSQPLGFNLQIEHLVEAKSIALLDLKYGHYYVFKAGFWNLQHCAVFSFLDVNDSSSCFPLVAHQHCCSSSVIYLHALACYLNDCLMIRCCICRLCRLM